MPEYAISREAAARLVDRIAGTFERSGRTSIRIMEVCGTHTMAIYSSGIRALLPEGIRLVSGPGCPVCVTSPSYLDRAIAMAREHSVTIATFGDMTRVPASNRTTLERERAAGVNVLTVYSPLDALRYAADHPDQRVVFLAVGFETTTPTIAGAAARARADRIENFQLLVAHKVVPPAMEAVLAGGAQLDGFLCPGHVSVIIGADAYEPIAARHGIPCVVAGFEPADVLSSVAMLVEQIADGRAEVENEYTRAVSRGGNPAARDLVDSVFEPSDADWRGLGIIPMSGLRLRDECASLDAALQYPVDVMDAPPPAGCQCGEVLSGRLEPDQCRMFGTACTPHSPVGPCMVSSEGSCAARYKYGPVAGGTH